MGYPDDGELTLELDNARISGWQSIRVTRGIERCPSDFAIGLTEKYPGSATEVSVAPGQVCRIKIGGDLVLTGYVDAYTASIEPNGHTVQIIGRSACEDIVDCSIVYRSPVINNTNVVDVATKLCADYGVKVTALAGKGADLPQITINLGETPYQVIERVARYSAMLVYDDTSGNLVLSQVGKEKHASGVTQALNVLAASQRFSYSQRYTEYHAYLQSTDSFADLGLPNQADGNSIQNGTATDPAMQYLKRPGGQKRNRVLSIITEQPDFGSGGYFATRRAKWELARRYGRSQALRVEVDSWRDSAGKLWEPNYRVPVDVPACKVTGVQWIIGEASYVRDENGTRADLIIMPPEAFEPEPEQLFPSPFGPLDIAPPPPPQTDSNFNPRLNEQRGGV